MATKVLAQHRDRLEEEVVAHQRRLVVVERLIRQQAPIVPCTVETRRIKPQHVVALRRTTDLEHIGAVIADGFGRLANAPGATGPPPSGMPFIVFHDVVDQDTSGDIEMCIPVEAETQVQDPDVQSLLVPGGMVASTVHQGEYAAVAPAHHVHTGWIQAHGHQLAGPPREIYLDDPSQVEPGTQRIKIQWPIA